MRGSLCQNRFQFRLSLQRVRGGPVLICINPAAGRRIEDFEVDQD